MTWPMVKFHELISSDGLFTDGDWVESKDQDPNGNVRLIQLADIGLGYFTNKSDRYLTKEKALELNCTFLNSGDILIARMPDPIGRACIFPQLHKECVTVVDICVVRPKNENVDSKWLMHCINSREFNNQILNYVTGTTRQRISRGNLSNLNIALPPLEEQKRIAAILDKADAIRQKRQQAIALADDFLRSVFLDMFGDPVTNPKGWDVKPLDFFSPNKGDIVDGPFGSSVNTKVDYIEEGEIPVIRTKNVSENGTFISNDLKFMNREKYLTIRRSAVVPGDIILTKVGTIGNVCIFPSKYPEAVLSTTGSCRIRLDESRINKTYFYYFLRYYKPKMLEVASAGVQPFLNMTHIKSFLVPTPDLAMQKKFEGITKKIESMSKKLSDSVKLPIVDSLYQKSFSGQL